MTPLPAPYESAPEDDLAAAGAAVVAGTTAALTAWVLGSATWDQVAVLRGLGRRVEDLPPEMVLVLAGWGLGAVLLGLGTLLLAFRRGRGWLGFGALLSVAGTIGAQTWYQFDRTEPHWLSFYGGVVVLLVVLLPALGRWTGRRPPRTPQVIGTVATGRPF